MNDLDQRQLLIDLSRDIVAQTAPQELPLFRPIIEAYLKNPEKTLKGQRNKDELLGFGITEVTMLLTPLVLATMTEVIKFVKDEYPGMVNSAVKSLFKQFRSTEQDKQKLPPPLTPEQLKRVHNIALEQAGSLLPAEQAKFLADAVTGSLVVAS